MEGGYTLSGFGRAAAAAAAAHGVEPRCCPRSRRASWRCRACWTRIASSSTSKVPGDVSRNVGLIRELNNNIRRVIDLYADLSSLFTASSGGGGGGRAASEGGSVGTMRQAGHKRIRSGLD